MPGDQEDTRETRANGIARRRIFSFEPHNISAVLEAEQNTFDDPPRLNAVSGSVTLALPRFRFAAPGCMPNIIDEPAIESAASTSKWARDLASSRSSKIAGQARARTLFEYFRLVRIFELSSKEFSNSTSSKGSSSKS